MVYTDERGTTYVSVVVKMDFCKKNMSLVDTLIVTYNVQTWWVRWRSW